jgi:colanic acid biosynthesis glycosyl transferase WcaI
MDLKPDEAIAAGWLKEDSFASRWLQRLLNYSLRHAAETIVLDRFMKERILAKGIDGRRVNIVAPWSHDDAVRYTQEGREAFRERHGLAEKFVIMYSGNHSPCHPLDTLCEAARRLAHRDQFAFCFVGGGSEQTKVARFAAQHRLSNVKCLPYQPLNELSESLSAADLHAVVMGEEFAGIVHPCKVYNIMAIGAPILYIGPQASHVSDIAAGTESGQFYLGRHGDIDGIVAKILEAEGRAESHRRGAQLSGGAKNFSKHRLMPQMIKLIEADAAPATLSAVGVTEPGAAEPV